MRDLLTTVLDAVALLLVAAGVAGGCWQWLGWWALVLAAVPLVVGSQLATWQARPAPRPAERVGG